MTDSSIASEAILRAARKLCENCSSWFHTPYGVLYKTFWGVKYRRAEKKDLCGLRSSNTGKVFWIAFSFTTKQEVTCRSKRSPLGRTEKYWKEMSWKAWTVFEAQLIGITSRLISESSRINVVCRPKTIRLFLMSGRNFSIHTGHNDLDYKNGNQGYFAPLTDGGYIDLGVFRVQTISVVHWCGPCAGCAAFTEEKRCCQDVFRVFGSLRLITSCSAIKR